MFLNKNLHWTNIFTFTWLNLIKNHPRRKWTTKIDIYIEAKNNFENNSSQKGANRNNLSENQTSGRTITFHTASPRSSI